MKNLLLIMVLVMITFTTTFAQEMHPMQSNFTYVNEDQTIVKLSADLLYPGQKMPHQIQGTVMSMLGWNPFILQIRNGTFKGLSETTLAMTFGYIIGHEDCSKFKIVLNTGISSRMLVIPPKDPGKNREVHTLGWRNHIFFASRKMAFSGIMEYYPTATLGLRTMYTGEFHRNLRPANKAPILVGVSVTNQYPTGKSSIESPKDIMAPYADVRIIVTALHLNGHLKTSIYAGKKSQGISIGYNIF